MYGVPLTGEALKGTRSHWMARGACNNEFHRMRWLAIAFWWVCIPAGAWSQETPLADLEEGFRQQEARIQELEQGQGSASPASQNAEANLEERLQQLEMRLLQVEDSAGQLRSDLESSFLESPSTESLRSSTGRVHLDYWGFPGDSPAANLLENGNPSSSVEDRFELRRIRFGIRGQVPPKNVSYQLDLEFSGIEQIGIRDAWIGLDDHFLFRTVRFGNQKRPYGLDQLNSSNFMVFMERPLILEAVDDPNRRLGIQSFGSTDDKRLNWRYGVFNLVTIEELGVIESNRYQGELAGRLATTAWYQNEGRDYLHLGIATSFGFPGGGISETTADYRTRPEARTGSVWYNTGRIGGTQATQLLAGEIVFNRGAFQTGAEYVNSWVQRETDAGPNVRFHGGYGYASYFLTGEYLPWNRDLGILGRVEPLHNFSGDRRGGCRGWGAWQIAARLSMADLNESDIHGGRGKSATFALNWYWNSHTRMQFNYIVGSIHDRAYPAPSDAQASGDYQIIGTRLMIDY
jgi:phosphate-selective porin OprO/OprP